MRSEDRELLTQLVEVIELEERRGRRAAKVTPSPAFMARLGVPLEDDHKTHRVPGFSPPLYYRTDGSGQVHFALIKRYVEPRNTEN